MKTKRQAKKKFTRSSAQLIKDLAKEPPNLGKIDVRLLESNPDIVKEKLEEKISFLLDKYGYGFKLQGFNWRDGDGNVPEAEIVLDKIRSDG